MRRRTRRTTIGLGLIALLGAMSTGLPSHSHVHGADHPGPEPRLDSGDHHAHGTSLVEQPDRVPQFLPHLAAPVVSSFAAPAVADLDPVVRPESFPAPTGRSPPPVIPRAPPRTT